MTHTPGPWYWDVREKYNVFRLCSPIRGMLIVMDFTRWGMQSAQPRFSDRNGERRGGIMEDGSKIDLSKNPDACLIAASPELFEACKAAEVWMIDFLNDTHAGNLTAGEVVKKLTVAIDAAIAKV